MSSRFSFVLLVVALTSPAAAEISKEACLTAHSRGQDVHEQGKLTLARKLFLTCAQSACPALVRDDCASSVDDLARTVPTLSFAARDQSGADLPATTVYVDDILTATRLDDGKAYDVDPGKHVIKFVHGTTEKVVTVVVGSGEKGRTVVTSFVTAQLGVTSEPEAKIKRPARSSKREEPSRGGAKVVMALGGIVAVGGATLSVIGIVRIPSRCSFSTRECAASPGDPVFAQAASAARLSNIGMLTTAIGLTAVAGGLVWYLAAEPATKERRLVAPWISPEPDGMAAGLVTSGRF